MAREDYSGREIRSPYSPLLCVSTILRIGTKTFFVTDTTVARKSTEGQWINVLGYDSFGYNAYPRHALIIPKVLEVVQERWLTPRFVHFGESIAVGVRALYNVRAVTSRLDPSRKILWCCLHMRCSKISYIFLDRASLVAADVSYSTKSP